MDVDSRVFTRMLRKDGRTDGRTDGSVTISLHNFVGEEIIIFYMHVRVYYHLLVTIYIMSWWSFHRLVLKGKG